MSGFRGLQARIAPGIDLQKITITLDPYGVPVIELVGHVRTGNRRVDTVSTAAVTTTNLTETGAKFIREMKSIFAPPAAE